MLATPAVIKGNECVVSHVMGHCGAICGAELEVKAAMPKSDQMNV